MKPWRIGAVLVLGTACGWLLFRARPAVEDSAPPAVEEVASAPATDAAVPAFSTGRIEQADLRAAFPPFPGATPWVDVGSRLELHGLPMNIVSFETTAKPEGVLEHYARHFDQRGWPWQGVRESVKSIPYPAISATLLEPELQLSVIAMPHEDGTTVLLAIADLGVLWARAQRGEKEQQLLPEYPGADALVMHSADGPVSGESASFSTPDSPEIVARTYGALLEARGFKKSGDELRFVAPSRAVRLYLSPGRDGGTRALASLSVATP